MRSYSRASLVAQMVKNLPAMQETWVWSLGWEDPLEKGMATHTGILAWRIPWIEEACRLHKESDMTERLTLLLLSLFTGSRSWDLDISWWGAAVVTIHPTVGKSIWEGEKKDDQFSSVQSLCRVQLFATPWIPACQASLFITNSRSLFKLMSIESVMPSSHLILCRPLLLLPPIPPSIRVFSNESTVCMRWPKYRSFSFSISPSNEHPGLISFRIDRLDLLAVQGTLRS